MVFGLVVANCRFDPTQAYNTYASNGAYGRPLWTEREELATLGVKEDEVITYAVVPLPTKLTWAAASEPKQKTDYLKLYLGVLSMAGGAVLGTCCALTFIGSMATPIGWAVGGALAFAGLAGSLFYGPKVFGMHVVAAFGGFCAGSIPTALTFGVGWLASRIVVGVTGGIAASALAIMGIYGANRMEDKGLLS